MSEFVSIPSSYIPPHDSNYAISSTIVPLAPSIPSLSIPVSSLVSRTPSSSRSSSVQRTQQSSLLVLADGTVIRGQGMGASGVVVGELVFQTGMVGYQEAMTDPSYAGQLLIFTYPLVGNYGVGERANQSARIQTSGVLLSDSMASSGHRDSNSDLDSMMREQGVPGMAGVDTRYLTRLVRMHGVLPAALAVGPASELPTTQALQALAAGLDYDGTDFVKKVSTPSLIWHAPTRPDGPRVALLDYGVKESTIIRLREKGAGILQIPAHYTSEEILALNPDGVLLSNGPGDPTQLDYAVNTVRGLMAQPDLPVFGICLGNQLLALAAGAKTHKMSFGHRGVNQPVLENETGRLYVTTQNHGYVVDADSVPADYRVTYTNLNDNTVEGIAHNTRPIAGVQWHPEAGPGPTDTVDMIDKFVALAEAKNA